MKKIVFAIALLTTICFTESVCAQETWTLDAPTKYALAGMGVELDPHFLTQNVAANNGTRAEDRENIIMRRLRMLDVQRLRVMVLPNWYEPENDNADPMVMNADGFKLRSPEMEELCMVLDDAEQRHLDVTVVFWGVAPNSFMRPNSGSGWMIGPTEMEEWAENLSVCLNYLIRERKYTCIREVTPVNEPDWSMDMGPVERLEQYEKMCRVLDERLRRDGLRQYVKLNLSDNSDGGSGTHVFLEGTVQRLSDVADLLNSHTYIFGYETPNSRMTTWQQENVAIAERIGKPHLIGEYGSNQTVGSTVQKDIDLYERGILMSRIAINLMNAGACGLSYWSLLDQYYWVGEAQSRSNMQRLGLWRYLKAEYEGQEIFHSLTEDYQPRPQYYAFGLLANNIRRGDRVYPIQTGHEFIAATALCSEKGRWTYIVANATDESRPIRIQNDKLKGKKKFRQSVYIQSSLPQGDSLIVPTAHVKAKNSAVETVLPPQSVMVLSNR